MRRTAWAAVVLSAVLAACSPDSGQAPPAAQAAAGVGLPRTALFGDPERKDAKLSPDGLWIGYLQKTAAGYDLMAASVADSADQRRLHAAVQSYEWAPGGTVAVIWTGADVRAVDVADTENPKLVEGAGDEERIDRVLIEQPGAVFLGSTPRRPGKLAMQLGDAAFELDAVSGDRDPLYQNRARYQSLIVDQDNRVRLGLKRLANGDWEIWNLERNGRRILTLTRADTPYFSLRGFAPDGKSFFLLAPLGLEQSALIRVDAATGGVTVAASNEKADIVDAWFGQDGAPVAYVSEYLRREIKPLTDAEGVEVDFLRQRVQGDFRVVSKSANDTRWLLREEAPTIAPRFWLYDRAAKTVDKLFDEKPSLADRAYATTVPVEIAARDGLILPALLTAPAGKQGPSPLLILAADDPAVRNHLGFSPDQQMFADLGYAVLAVNQRGATGFGAAFAKAANGAFGAKMQADLIDAAHWAVAQKIAEPGKIGILGLGLGGYGAAAAAAFTPKEFNCIVAVDAPLDLTAAPITDMALRIADPATAEGAAKLKALSPISQGDKIETPLLLVRRDWRIPRGDGDELASALVANGRPVAYAQFAAESEGFANAADKTAFYALAGAFLSQCLGGRADPIGPDFKNSSLQILEGGKLIPNLATAMAPRDGELGAPP